MTDRQTQTDSKEGVRRLVHRKNVSLIKNIIDVNV
jgi:hypothetical protein